jgi:manganese-dependent inorganic pyrophosphatase
VTASPWAAAPRAAERRQGSPNDRRSSQEAAIVDHVRVEDSAEDARRSRIYVTGHRNPDLDSIAAAIGYAELKNRIDSECEYVPVRLGRLNAQTQWALELSGARRPDLMEHVMLRVRDVMRESFPIARHEEPLRDVGRTMVRENLDLVPIVDDDGRLLGVMTERGLARRYIREARRSHTLADSPTSVEAIVTVLDGELIAGEGMTVAGRVWVHSIDASRSDSRISTGDVVVVGNRTDAQRQSLELGAALIVTSNGVAPEDEIVALARERGAGLVVSPLDSYVTRRMISLAAPCEGMADRDPLTVELDDLLSDVSEQVKDVHYRAAVTVDRDRRPIGLLTRSDLLAPQPRRVILVDHAEQAQSVNGVEQAEIVEILDHHHIGSIETRVPVAATFDPVGSTATLVVERFRHHGVEPTREAAAMLLCAILSDTVLLNSPTAVERDRRAIAHLEELLGVEGLETGRRMFEETSDVSDLSAEEVVTRDAKEYQVAGGGMVSIAQIETVGDRVLERREELIEAIEEVRRAGDYQLAALMVTDILERRTTLIASGDTKAVERAFGDRDGDGIFSLPGVMSRKKQVAPVLLGAM